MADIDDNAARVALAQRLMVEITIRLEELAGHAARLQRSLTSDPGVGEDVQAVRDLIAAHGRLLPRRPTRARSRT